MAKLQSVIDTGKCELLSRTTKQAVAKELHCMIHLATPDDIIDIQSAIKLL